MDNVKKIYITGCGKSGTTLLFWLFRAFDIDYTPYTEILIKDFIVFSKKSKNDVFVGKRGGKTILSFETITHNEKERQLKIIKDNDIKIINVIRDGRDVVLSNNNYVSPATWISCMKQRRKRIGKFIRYEVRYEDLIANPDDIQLRIADKFGLTIKYKFSEYPNFVSDSTFEAVKKKILKNKLERPNYKEKISSYTKRPLTDGSIGKDKKAYIKLCKSTQERLEFEEELRLAGYIK